MIVVRITHLISYEHGEYEPDESSYERNLESWDELPEHLRDENGRDLDIIRIEVL